MYHCFAFAPLSSVGHSLVGLFLGSLLCSMSFPFLTLHCLGYCSYRVSFSKFQGCYTPTIQVLVSVYICIQRSYWDFVKITLNLWMGFEELTFLPCCLSSYMGLVWVPSLVLYSLHRDPWHILLDLILIWGEAIIKFF